MATNKDELIVGGFHFCSEEDADLARLELEKIKALESRMDYHDVETVVSVYNRAVMNRTFQTPVGHQYLLGVKDYLLKTGAATEKELRAIPLQVHFSGRTQSARTQKTESAGAKKAPASSNTPLGISVAVNVILVILVGAMFLITLYGENPNILNYKSRIIDEYASWEQELQDREREIRERERELGIVPRRENRSQDEETQ